MRDVVAVLRGGPSSEYEVSLKTGASVLAELDRARYDARDIFIDRAGVWHFQGMPATPEKALRGVDVAFNAMYGEYGEDGGVQRTLDALGMPYTGSDAITSALTFNKQRTKEAVQKLGVKVAHGIVVQPSPSTNLAGSLQTWLGQEANEALAVSIFRSFPHPAIVKPATGGSSVGVAIARDFHTLQWALGRAAAVSPQVLVEEFILGKEATVGVVENFRNQAAYALMPVEIVPPPSRPFFDYEAKYSGESTERCPGNFTHEEKQQLEELARTVHTGLGLAHYSRSDFIVGKRGIYFLEVNTLPGLTKESLLPKALAAAGAKFSDFLHHVISLARVGKKGRV